MSVSVQTLSIRNWDATQVEHDLTLDDAGKTLRSEMVRALLGNDDQMGVRDSITVNDIAHSLERKHLTQPPADVLGEGHDLRRDRVGHIGEVIDV